MRLPWSAILVHGCSVLLGINSLISTNGLWMELPIMIYKLPEGWALASYLTAIIQMANIGPIIYSLLLYILPGKFTERPWVYAMLIDGLVAALLMAIYWDTTIEINGKEHSIPLFILTFCLALVDSLSSVVCLPFMAFLKPIYVNSYMIGEGLSGFLPSVAAIVQGADDHSDCQNMSLLATSLQDLNYSLIPEEPVQHTSLRFTVSAFFYFLSAMMAFSLIGFSLLCHSSLAKKEYVAIIETKGDYNKVKEQDDALFPLQDLKEPFGDSHKKFPVGLKLEIGITDAMKQSKLDYKDEVLDEKKGKKSLYYILLAIQTWVSCLVLGAMPSIQSYSCAPYGPVPFHMAVVISSLANPVSAFIAIWMPLKSLYKTVILTAVGTALASYLLLTAIMSPTPPLVNSVAGSAIMVTAWIIFSSIFGYVKVSVACLLRDFGHGALFWCGVATQLGATVGAIVLFIFVNVLEYFVEENPC